MRYLGSKADIANDIAHYVYEVRKLKAIERGRLPGYWEPMVGGLSVFHKIRGGNIYGSDSHPWLVATHKHAYETGWRPPKAITFDLYQRANQLAKTVPIEELDPSMRALIGFIGFACSHSGKWFASFARDEKGKPHVEKTQQRSYAYRINRIQDGAEFFVADFLTYNPPERGMVIYCDPPYLNTEPYKTGGVSDNGSWARKEFDHNVFWQRVRELESGGHTVIVSEYQAPSDFSCVMEMVTRIGVRTSEGGNEKRVERLFRHGKIVPVQRRLL